MLFVTMSFPFKTFIAIAHSGSEDTTVRVWDIDTGACLHVLPDHDHDVICMTFVSVWADHVHLHDIIYNTILYYIILFTIIRT